MNGYMCLVLGNQIEKSLVGHQNDFFTLLLTQTYNNYIHTFFCATYVRITVFTLHIQL